MHEKQKVDPEVLRRLVFGWYPVLQALGTYVGGSAGFRVDAENDLGVNSVFVRDDGTRVTVTELARLSGEELFIEYSRLNLPSRFMRSQADLVAYAQVNRDRVVVVATPALQEMVKARVHGQDKGNGRVVKTREALYVSIPTEALLREPVPIAILPVVGLRRRVLRALHSTHPTGRVGLQR